MSSSAAVKEGQKYLKQAQDQLKTSFLDFRFSPDWDSACRYCRQAIDKLKMTGDSGMSVLHEAYKFGITANDKASNYFTCAQYCENYMDSLIQIKIKKNSNGGDYSNTTTDKLSSDDDEIYKLAINGSLFYRRNRNEQQAVSLLLKAAQHFKTCKQYIQAVELGKKACSLFDDNPNPVLAEKPLMQTMTYIMLNDGDKIEKYKKQQQNASTVTSSILPSWVYQDAIDFLSYQNSIYKKVPVYATNIHKNYLSELVLLLYRGNDDYARKIWTKHTEEDSTFLQQYEYAAGNELLDAIMLTQQDYEKVRTSRSILMYLDSNIAILLRHIKAKGLSQDDISIDQQQLDYTDVFNEGAREEELRQKQQQQQQQPQNNDDSINAIDVDPQVQDTTTVNNTTTVDDDDGLDFT